MTKADKIKKILVGAKNATIQNKALCFLPGDRRPLQTAGKGFKGRLQNRLKGYGKVYQLLRDIFKPVFANRAFRLRCKTLLQQYNDRDIILHIGSGPTYYMNRKDIINVDIFAFKEVDLVADASRLPIKDESADLVISLAVLEHVEDPEAIVNEIRRVMKQGARVVCYLPFIVPFHAAPDDFHRWTVSGIKTLFAGFEEVEVFLGAGPTSGLLWVFQEWLSILLSFGNKGLHDILFMFFMVITSPVKLLDLFMIKLPYAENIASGFCVFGKKGNSE